MAARRLPFSKPLPGRVVAFPDEPPYGLLLRTCERNGAFEVYTNFQRAGIVTGQEVCGLAVKRVAFICSQTPRAISAAAPEATTSHVRFRRETLFRDQFSTLFRRWCPACMAEEPYHRVWWDVPPITACPEHGLKLTSDCGCPRRPLWRSSPLTKCRIGHAFAFTPKVAASPDEIALAAYARARLLGRRRAGNALLDGLDLGEAFRVCERIGKASLDETMRHGRRRAGREGLAAEGFRVLADFGPRFDDVLDRLIADRARRRGPRQWGAEHAYGPFYLWIAEYPDGSPFAAAIKAAVAAHAVRHVRLKTGHRVAGVEVAIPGGVDMTSAAAEWGVTFERFRRLATAVGLIPKTSLRGRPARLDPDAVRDWAARIRTAKTGTEIAAELGIAPHAAAGLIRASLLPAIVDGQKDRDNRLNIWLLPGGVADDLLARLAAVARPLPEDRAKLLPISIVARMARAPLARLLEAALDGRLPIHRDPAGAGLAGFLVRKGDAQVTTRRQRVPGMTITEAGEALGLHADTMAQLREAGMLKTGKVGRIHSVSLDEIARFRAAYAGTEELARAFGLPRGSSAIAALREEGVEPVCARPSFRQVLFDRPAATAALERRRDRLRAVEAQTLELGDTVDTASFAQAVAITAQLARELVVAGAVRGARTGKNFAIARSEIDRFKREFAGAAEFAPLIGANHRAVGAVLARAGVKPVFGPPKFYSHLYRRPEAEAAIARHLEDVEADRRDEAEASADDARDPLLVGKDACKAIGCQDMMLTQLRKAGLVEGARRGKAIVYRRSELDRFNARYVLGSELGAMIGRPGKDGGKAMTSVVIGLGVKPVCARPRFQSFLFERAEAMAALKRWDGITNRHTGRGRGNA